MAEIRNFAFIRHLRAEPTSHIIKYKKGQVERSEMWCGFVVLTNVIWTGRSTHQ